jgi:dephospho-CoA kinase
VLVVDCAEDTQVQRVVARSGWREDAVRAVIAQQASRAQRRAVADAVILNDGLTLDALAAEVHALWQRWCSPPQAQACETIQH